MTDIERSTAPAKETTEPIKSIGTRGFTVRVFERTRRGGPPQVMVGWRDRETGRSKRKVMSVEVRKSGRRTAELMKAAVERATEWQQSWADGAPEPMSKSEWAALQAKPQAFPMAPRAEPTEVNARTLHWLFDRVYGPSLRKLTRSERIKLRGSLVDLSADGEAPAYEVYEQQSVLRRDSADRIEDVLGRDRLLSSLDVGAVDAIFNTIRVGAMKGGFERARFMAETLRHALNWANSAQIKGVPALNVLPKGWKEQRREGWQKATGGRRSSGAKENQPRYTPQEMARLVAAADRGLAPPRVCLAVKLLGQVRVGAAAQYLKRSHLHLIDEESEHGRLEIPGIRNKPGTTYHLTSYERVALLRWLNGPMRACEAHYQVSPGEHGNDYFLFPSGAADRKTGVYPVKARQKGISEARMTDEWNQLERAAGVDHVHKRNWYGMKRALIDRSAELAQEMGITDTAVLDSLTGHSSSQSIRVTVYRSKLGSATLRDAMRIRDRLVKHYLGQAPAEWGPPAVVSPRLLAREANPGDGGNKARAARRAVARETRAKLKAARAPKPKPTGVDALIAAVLS
jgi:hypothetical protein